MMLRQVCTAFMAAGCILLSAPIELGAQIVASTSFEATEGYTPAGTDVRSYPAAQLSEPGDWSGNTFAGSNGGNLYTPVLDEPGGAFDGTQFVMMQRSGSNSDGNLILRRKFPEQTGLLYYRWAFRIDSQQTEPNYWQASNRIDFSIDRKINDALDGSSSSHMGRETMRIELDRDGRIIIKQSSFGGDITLPKRWDGTTTDESAPLTSALNNWVKVETLLDIQAQRWWLVWDGTLVGSYPFRQNLLNTSGSLVGVRQVNMIRFQAPRLDFAARGERLRIDDIDLRTEPPGPLAECLTVVTPGDADFTANVGQPPSPPGVDFIIHNFGSNEVNWTVTELDADQNPADVSWISLSSSGGSIASMQSVSTTVNIDPAGLAGGEYIAYLKFTDECNPANEHIRQIRLNVIGCVWELSGCNEVRSYLEAYPNAEVPPVVYRITNTGQHPTTYQVVQSGSSCVSGLWELTNASGVVEVGEFVDVIATFNPEAVASLTPGDSYTCNLTFSDTCSSQVLTRTIRLRYASAEDTVVARYHGHVDPLTNSSAGPGVRFDGYREDNLSHYGAVEDDPDATDGKVWRIQDGPGQKAKYRLTHDDTGSPFEVANEVGATVVARVKVRSHSGGTEGGLYIWEEDAGGCTYHWGGETGLVREQRRGVQAIVPGTSDFVILRMTTIGRADTPWACSRIVRLYFNEDPTPVVEIIGGGQSADLYEGMGFGAGSTGGSYDIAFDWITATNAGAFAPGEEEAVLGESLVPLACPADWADFDGDGDVDPDDFGAWQLCYTGSDALLPDSASPKCVCADRNQDGHVDEIDLTVFGACASRSGVLLDLQNLPPGCQ